MPGTAEYLNAYLILDNCFLVMLTDCFCDRFAVRYVPNRVIYEAEQWIDNILEILKQFAIDGNLHCSDTVANEYYPHVGRLSTRPGIQRNDLNHLQTHVRNHLYQVSADIAKGANLRSLPAANRSLIGPGGLSDNDLSLVQLGLDLSQNGSPVYILSNDQSLLDFISWVRVQRQQFQLPINPSLLQGWRCLTYLELIHRSCSIPSDLMKELIEYALYDHYNRTEIAGSKKGNIIFQQLLQVHENFNQSIIIKQQLKAGAA